MKKILIASLLALTIQTFTMELPPQAEKSYLEQLPGDVRLELLHHIYRGGQYPNIKALARAIAAMEQVISGDGMISILQSLPYTTSALDVARELRNLPVMATPEVHTWLRIAKNSLRDGHTLFFYVILNNESEVKELLKEKNINVNLSDYRFTERFGNETKSPLKWAVQERRTNIVEMLLKAGANPNIQDHKKVTPLMVAAGQRNTKIVTMLIAAGADIRLKSKSGKTAYDYNQEAMQEYAMNAFFTRGALT